MIDFRKKLLILSIIIGSCKCSNRDDFHKPHKKYEPIILSSSSFPPDEEDKSSIPLKVGNEPFILERDDYQNLSDTDASEFSDPWEKDVSFIHRRHAKLTKILSFDHNFIKSSVPKNFFKVEDYLTVKDSKEVHSDETDSRVIVDKKGKEIPITDVDTRFDIFLFQNEEKKENLLFFHSLRWSTDVEERDGYFYPLKLYFELQNERLGIIDIQHRRNWSVYSYRNSGIYVNNQDATQSPFYMRRSYINIDEIVDLVRRLVCTDCIQFIKYFFDFIAYKNGIRIVFVKNYFDIKLEYYDLDINLNEESNEVMQQLTQQLNMITISQEDEQNLSCTKLYVKFPIKDFVAQHILLLVGYVDQFFIIDTNGANHDYLGPSFKDAISTLKIKFCQNKKFIQRGFTCDTCTSIMEVLISDYWREYGHILPLNEDGDIDFDTIWAYTKIRPFYPIVKKFF